MNMDNLFDLTNKVAVVTGAGGALGGAAARYLGAQGVTVVCVGRTANTIESTSRAINNSGGISLPLPGDVLQENSMQEIKERIMSEYGQLDILLNAAGGNQPGAVVSPDQSFFDMSIDAFQQVTDLNLKGTVLPSLILGKIMADQNKGSIVNYSSMAVPRAITRVAGYSASKAGAENFTRWMAVEMAHKLGEGIRVNAVAPGFFIGDQNRALLTNPDGSLTSRGAAIVRNTPFGRFGEPEELNGAIHYLCSDASHFVTGIVIPVDGGFSAFSGV